ncbi:dethiobiotin synthase [Staphylococcus sp. SQ8-PEA]|uniref:ATP-dependent dethiobiotin synthetase BioD n=1 Tax=Staphylococcus marylandisciuri TaxID=2981529 RepID=A0ABT2QQT4_9STAP|nr:dethiobiotin synthase [Staphylococcus marylandisciuri]MCU5746307.1 dethiobiotin synthase [Staphylococcus marylandisciuri]
MKIFITSTNTDIGKTYITQNLYHFFKNHGYSVTIFKPLQTEEMPDGTYPDLETYKRDCGLSYEETALYKFKDPVSPHLAFKRQPEQIFKRELIIEKLNTLTKKYEIVLIEGAGGIAVPIYEGSDNFYMTTDLISDLNPEHIISVVPSKLGAIGDTVVHQQYLNFNELTHNILIMNDYTGTDVEEDNKQTIEKLLHKQVLTFPHNGQYTDFDVQLLKLLEEDVVDEVE